MLAEAPATHEAVRIEYFSAGRGVATERVIEPWAMGVDRGAWYVRRGAAGPAPNACSASTACTPSSRSASTSSRPRTRATPRADFARDAADLPRATGAGSPRDRGDVTEREWPGATFREEADGSIVAQIPFASEEWVARRVAARLGSAIVLDPASLRETVVEIACRMRGRP